MQFEIGQTIGDYEFIDLLESSKSGVSYRVRNMLAHRLEMLKVLPKSMQDDRERVERFLREIKVHARLNHPNIVTFYNAAQLEGQLVMTTELVEGTTLAHLLGEGAVPLVEALSIVSQVLSALTYAHQQGVIHREITPENIILMPNGGVKLTGFGLAKTSHDAQLTQAGAVMGCLEYISPEQVKGVTKLDGRADLYSLGAVFYHAVTGRLLFDLKSQFEVMLAHVNTPPTPPSRINPDLPAEVDQVILTALAKDPSERFETAEVFQQAVEALRSPAAVPAAAPAQTPPPAVRGPERVKHEIPPLSLPGAVAARRASAWGSRELMAAGVFTFLIMAMAFFALLTLTKP